MSTASVFVIAICSAITAGVLLAIVREIRLTLSLRRGIREWRTGDALDRQLNEIQQETMRLVVRKAYLAGWLDRPTENDPDTAVDAYLLLEHDHAARYVTARER